jgi:two-component system OmpR family sensor kinase
MKKKWHWLILFLPALLGFILQLWFNNGQMVNPIVYVRVDVGTLVFLLGILISVISLVVNIVRQNIQKTHNEVIRNADEERRRFLRRLDHELKNPLTAIMAGLANLKTDNTEQEKSLSSIEAQTRRLSRLVTELRKLSDLETRDIDQGPVDLNLLLDEVFCLTKEKPEAAKLELNCVIPHAPWPLPKIQGDYDLLFLAVHNLLDNAIKYSDPGGTVELRAFEDRDNVLIEVADTGIGIPADEQPLVWEELYRGNSARRIQGSGLGLALVKAVANRHKGQINLRSRPNEGTVISLRLPIH